MSDKTLTFTVEQLAEALDNVRCMYDLGPELIAEQVFAASAQQPAQAAPANYERMFRMAVDSLIAAGEAAGVRAEDQMNGATEIIAAIETIKARRDSWRRRAEAAEAALAAAPAAPVAQEPVAWQFREIGEGEWRDCDEAWHDYCYRSPQHDTRRLYTAPTAAEQKECSACSDLVAEITAIRAGKSYCGSCASGCTQCEVVQGAVDAEQPDTVAVPRATAIALLDDGSRQETWDAQDELRALLATAPAAPVAQGQWPSGCPCNSAPGPCENCPPAAEQPECVTCSGHGLVGNRLDDGEACPECHGAGVIFGTECGACAEQPGTVAVPRELLERACTPRNVPGGYWAAMTAINDLRALLGKEGEA